jgi:hypothetical protein
LFGAHLPFDGPLNTKANGCNWPEIVHDPGVGVECPVLAG